jgi:hypothetical protein
LIYRLLNPAINIAACVTPIPTIRANKFIGKSLKAYQRPIPKSGNFTVKTLNASNIEKGFATLRSFSLINMLIDHHANEKNRRLTIEPAIKPFVIDWSPYNNETRIINPERAKDKKKFFLGCPGSETCFLVNYYYS